MLETWLQVHGQHSDTHHLVKAANQKSFKFTGYLSRVPELQRSTLSCYILRAFYDAATLLNFP